MPLRYGAVRGQAAPHRVGRAFWSERVKEPCKALLAGALCAVLTGMASPARGAPQDGSPPGDVPVTELAPTSATLDMQRAVAAAVAWHPSVRSAAGYVFEAENYIDVARAGYLPQVRAGVTSEHGSRNVPGYNSRQAHRFVVSASQMLYDFGKTSSAVDRAQADRAAAQARVLLAVDDLARDTAQAWIEVRRYEQLRQIAREQTRGVTAIADLVRTRRSKGASPMSDEMQAQAREEAARAFELETDAQLERWRAQLRHLTGLRAVPVTGGDPPSAMAQACFAPADSPEPPSVLVARAEARAAQADVDNARAQSRPTLSLDGSVGRGLDADSRMGDSHDSTIMLNVSAPLYQGGGNVARQRAAGHVLGAAEAALENARLANSQLLQDARTQAAGNAQRSGVLDDRVESLAQTRTLYRQQYLDLGTRSLLDLLNAEQEYQQARLEQANNGHDLSRLEVSCLYGTGRLREAFGLEGRQVAGLELLP
jgi:adhesin transport system outer membrane protein